MSDRGLGVIVIVFGIITVLLGVSYISWGNWIPFAAKVNNPDASGWLQCGLGCGVIAVGIGMIVFAKE